MVFTVCRPIYVKLNIIRSSSVEKLVASATGGYGETPAPAADVSGRGGGGVCGLSGGGEPCQPDPDGLTAGGAGSAELAGIECRLETKDLWDKFHELGTEMIITKTGR